MPAGKRISPILGVSVTAPPEESSAVFLPELAPPKCSNTLCLRISAPISLPRAWKASSVSSRSNRNPTRNVCPAGGLDSSVMSSGMSGKAVSGSSVHLWMLPLCLQDFIFGRQVTIARQINIGSGFIRSALVRHGICWSSGWARTNPQPPPDGLCFPDFSPGKHRVPSGPA